jgi:hypothetical protein
MKRTGRARVVAIAAKTPRIATIITIAGGPSPMTDAAAAAIEELIATGRAMDAAARRERGSAS